MRTSSARVLLLLAAACGLVAAFIAVTGGVETRVAGIPLRARSWERPAVLAAGAALAALVLLRSRLAAAWPAPAAIGRGGQRLLVALAAVFAAIVSLGFGTYAAGGSDSFGYVSQARLLAAGQLVDMHPMHAAFTWPDVSATLAPLGYRPGIAQGTLAPTYPPGVPLLMAPLAAVHADAVFLLVPLTAVAVVWLCWPLGTAFGSPLAGALGACLLAASPTFLYHAVQPMSDVPVAACWTGALLLSRLRGRRGSIAAGCVAGLAILIRPNLAPLAVFVIGSAAMAGGGWRGRAASCGLAMTPALATLGLISGVRYGSPLGSGYGTLDYLFSLENVVPNLGRYTGWLTAMHTPLVWAWLLAPLWLRTTSSGVRRFGWVCWGFSLAVFAAYLPYAVFNPEEWFYTRFLLPALPAMLVLGAAVMLASARRVVRHPELATVLVIAMLVAFGLTRAVSGGVFDLAAAERRYPAVGHFVGERLRADAFVIADQHSGSIRYYAGTPTLRWRLLHPESLGAAVEGLREAGYTPYVVLDPFEEADFRDRFAASAALLARLTLVETVQGTRVYAFTPSPRA
jgi:hypothetical protein